MLWVVHHNVTVFSLFVVFYRIAPGRTDQPRRTQPDNQVNANEPANFTPNLDAAFLGSLAATAVSNGGTAK